MRNSSRPDRRFGSRYFGRGVAALWVVGFAVTSASAGAAPITYAIHRSLSSSALVGVCGQPNTPPCFTYTLDGTVTSDGTLGDWAGVSHFTAIALTLSDGTNAAILDQLISNGTSAISATADDLRVSFGIPVSFGDAPAPTSSWTFCATQRSGCSERAVLSTNGLWVEDAMRDGALSATLYVIGVALPVPEPSTAVLGGLGLALLAARRRSRR